MSKKASKTALREYRFVVPGLPPRRRTTRPVWAKPLEIPRLMELRFAAHDALKGGKPLRRDICLRIVLMLPDAASASINDYVAGICAGLQRADDAERPHVGVRWDGEDVQGIHPLRFSMIADEREINVVVAEKHGGEVEAPMYIVEIAGT